MKQKPTPRTRSSKLLAIASGLERARELHHDKDYDIAIAVKIALDSAGFKIIKKASRNVY